jgi:acetyl-CoA C-acetyltransferase
MGLGPVEAVKRLEQRSGIVRNAFERIEANEAFAVQALAVQRRLELDPAKVNVTGGAIALGHPIGASGARILVTLIHGLVRENQRLGLATLCVGGGQGVAIAVARV